MLKRENSKSKTNKKSQNNKKRVLVYSSIEQKKNRITGIGTYFKRLFIIFPAIPLFLALFSCYIRKISDHTYFILLCLMEGIAICWFLFQIVIWIRRILNVYLIDEDGTLYYLRVSLFWYQIKDKMYMLTEGAYAKFRIMRMYNMFKNIKRVVNAVSEEMNLDEIVATGQLLRIKEITELKIQKQQIRMDAIVESKNECIERKIKIPKVYDKMYIFEEYLVTYKEQGKEKALETDFEKKDSTIVNLFQKKTAMQKIIRFNFVYGTILLWIAVITLSRDLNMYSKIRAGQMKKVTAYEVKESDNASEKENMIKVTYQVNSESYYKEISKNEQSKDEKNQKQISLYYETKKPQNSYLESEFGTVIRPFIICSLTIEFVYVFWILSDVLIDYMKKNRDKKS